MKKTVVTEKKAVTKKTAVKKEVKEAKILPTLKKALPKKATDKSAPKKAVKKTAVKKEVAKEESKPIMWDRNRMIDYIIQKNLVEIIGGGSAEELFTELSKWQDADLWDIISNESKSIAFGAGSGFEPNESFAPAQEIIREPGTKVYPIHEEDENAEDNEQNIEEETEEETDEEEPTQEGASEHIGEDGKNENGEFTQ